MIGQYGAIFAVLLLAGLTVFQLALIAGAPLGHMAWGGQHEVLPVPLRIGSVVSIGIYAVFAVVLLDRAGLISVFGRDFSGAGAWAIAAYGALGTGLNAISRSRVERLVMTPVAFLLAGAAGLVAWT